jgi:hypothetical protein
MKSIAKISIQTFLLALFGIVNAHFSSHIMAQDRSPGPPVMTGDADFEARSNTLRNMTAEKPKENRAPAPRRDPKVVLDEAREDYKFLQVDNKGLKQTLATATVFDPASVSVWLTDIEKRAERLSVNLALPELDKKAERMKINPATDADEFKASVSSLSDLIRGFITNPCFREPALLVNEQTLKARVDLEDVIALTKQLQKDSQKFKKTDSQP